MSNGTGQSRASYIIICSGEIDVLNAPNHKSKMQAASNAARNLTTFYGDKLTAAQTAPISELQHEMMDNFNTWKKAQAEKAVADMFLLLHELEDEMEG